MKSDMREQRGGRGGRRGRRFERDWCRSDRDRSTWRQRVGWREDRRLCRRWWWGHNQLLLEACSGKGWWRSFGFVYESLPCAFTQSS